MRLPPPSHTTLHAPHLSGIPERSAAQSSPAAARSSHLTPPPIGLGDLVYRVADPIARLIDRCTARLPARLRTHVAGCSACSRRRRRLNTLTPDMLAPVRPLAAALQRLRS